MSNQVQNVSRDLGRNPDVECVRSGGSADVRVEIVNTLRAMLSSGNAVHRCLAAQVLGRLKERAALPDLLRCVQDGDEDVAFDAVEALGALEEATAVPLLTELYTHADIGALKVAAAEALGRIGGGGATGVLLAVAAGRHPSWERVDGEDWDEYWDAQLAAVEALGRLGEPRAVPVIVKVLEDEEAQELSAAGITALAGCGAVGRAALSRRLRTGSPVERRLVTQILAGHHAEHPEGELERELLAGLDDDDGAVRALALAAVAGRVTDKRLTRLGRDEDPAVRLKVVEIMACRPPASFAEQWFRFSRDADPRVRREYVTALPRLMGRKSVPHLLRAVKDTHQEVAVAAVRALGVFGGELALGALSEEAAHPDRPPIVRVSAVEALARLDRPPVAEMLLGLLSDDDPAIRLTALEGLAGPKEARNISFLLSVLRGEVIAQEPAEEADPATSSLEVPAAEDDEGEHRANAPMEPSEEGTGREEGRPVPDGNSHPGPSSTLQAIMAGFPLAEKDGIEEEAEEFTGEEREFLQLAREKTRQNGDLLRPRRLPPELDVCVMAARMLGNSAMHASDGAEVVDALREALAHQEPELREAAAQALGSLQAGDAAEALSALLGDDQWGVRLAAVRTLTRLNGERARVEFPAMWRDPSPAVRLEMVQAMGEMAAQTVAQGAAADSLDPYFSLLAESLEDKDTDVARTAAEALFRLGRVDLLPRVLTRMAEDSLHRWEGLGEALLEGCPEVAGASLTAMVRRAEGEWLFPVAVALMEEIARRG